MERKQGLEMFEAQFDLVQEADTCSPQDTHCLRVKVEDGGGGPFLVLETERWALDPEDLQPLVKSLKKIHNFVKNFGKGT